MADIQLSTLGSVIKTAYEGEVDTNAFTDAEKAALAAAAPLASPALTGTPTAPTAAPGTNTTQIATSAFVQAAIAALLNSAPGALDTLDELAAALGDDANFAATMTTALAGKAAVSHSHSASEISDSTAAGRAMLLAATAAAQTALLNAFTSSLKGLVPASGGGTTNYLRADGTWAAPAGGSGSSDSRLTVYNGTGGALTKATPVALGTFDATSGNPGVVAADADGSGTMPCIGLVLADIADASSGTIIVSGEITGLNTSAYSLGDKLYVSASGGLTDVRPTSGFIQAVAVVSRVDAANGEILVVIEEAGQLYTDTFTVAVSDEDTALATGTGKLTFRMPYAMTLTAIRASVKTAPTGAALTVDVNEGGASILSTKLTIDATEKTSVTAATPAVISDSALADDAEITIDIDAVGSTVAGSGLKLTFYGYRG